MRSRMLAATVGAALTCVVLSAVPAMAQKTTPAQQRGASTDADPSGPLDFRDLELGTRITECPQAGLRDPRTRPLDRRDIDVVERLSRRGDDVRANQDFSCLPQNETSVAFSRRFPDNLLLGANDYRLGAGSSGFYASSNRGRGFYDGIIPFPSGPPAQTRGEGFIISGGDPVTVTDRDGVGYYAMISFFRGDDTNGVMVSRSTNGGFTWSRACIPFGTTDATASCNSSPGDARQPGDGRVTFSPDDDLVLNGSQPFDDKEWMTAGPRPDGVGPDCFTPIARTRVDCDPDVVGSDRLYVTFTRFFGGASQISMSYSDDQARSWSPAKAISGSAAFCVGAAAGPGRCDDNQYSVPTASPVTGALYVAFVNSDTPDEDQYLVVRSRDGGQTFEGPFHVTPVFDVNFPRAGAAGGRPDCTQRGQQAGRIVYTNSCFRSNAGGNIVVDKRGGGFADDLYLVMSDNRNGTPASSNADIFLFKSTNGGSTWIGPTRVNDDRSVAPPDRDAPTMGDFGNDQWWPWADIGRNGTLAVGFNDRRLDRDSTAHEWPMSRQRPGNYLVWFWGAGCEVDRPDSRECLADGAAPIPQPTAPVDPGSGPQPGQGDAFVGDFENQKVSDVPSNYDYAFRAGIFAGDYNNIAVLPGRHGRERALGMWTDARNGRSSREQAGRNPICEQSDVFFDTFDPLSRGDGDGAGPTTPFLITPCPGDAVGPWQSP